MGQVIEAKNGVPPRVHRSEGSPCTGYLVPVRDGPGLMPEWEKCWDAAVVFAVTWTCWKTTTFDNLGTSKYSYTYGGEK